MFGMAAGDNVQKIVLGGALDKALVDQPVFVEGLGEIFVAGIANKRNHPFWGFLFAAVSESRAQQRSGGRAGDDALFSQQLPDHLHGLLVGNGIGVVANLEVQNLRDIVLADPFHHPGAHFLRQRAGLDPLGQHRSFRIGQDHLGLGRDFIEKFRQPGDRAARADPGDYGIDLVVHLFPDLGPGGGLMGVRVGRVAELVDQKRARGFFCYPLRHVGVIFGMALAHVGTGDDAFGPQGLEVKDFVFRHFIGDHQYKLVALLRGHQRQPEAGVAGGRLDQGAARLQAAVRLSRRDHSQGNPVLDRPARVLVFQLQVKLATAGVDFGHFQHRRVADHGKNVMGRFRGGAGHGLFLNLSCRYPE